MNALLLLLSATLSAAEPWDAPGAFGTRFKDGRAIQWTVAERPPLPRLKRALDSDDAFDRAEALAVGLASGLAGADYAPDENAIASLRSALARARRDFPEIAALRDLREPMTLVGLRLDESLTGLVIKSTAEKRAPGKNGEFLFERLGYGPIDRLAAPLGGKFSVWRLDDDALIAVKFPRPLALRALAAEFKKLRGVQEALTEDQFDDEIPVISVERAGAEWRIMLHEGRDCDPDCAEEQRWFFVVDAQGARWTGSYRRVKGRVATGTVPPGLEPRVRGVPVK